MKIYYDGVEVCSSNGAANPADTIRDYGVSVTDEALIEIRPESLDETRQLREPLLADADILVNKAEDLGTASKITAARNYRKALRGITNGVTDYTTITWPTPPVV